VRDAAYLFHFCDSDRNLAVSEHQVLAGLRAYGVRLSAAELRERWRVASGRDAGVAASTPLPETLSFEQYLNFLWDVRLSLTRERSTLRDDSVRGVEQKGLLGLRPTQ